MERYSTATDNYRCILEIVKMTSMKLEGKNVVTFKKETAEMEQTVHLNTHYPENVEMGLTVGSKLQENVDFTMIDQKHLEQRTRQVTSGIACMDQIVEICHYAL